MDRRHFSQVLATGIGVSSLATWSTQAFSQTPALQEGRDYRRMGTPVATDTPAGQIEVLEFFSYSCVHCYRFEPLLSDWMKTLPAQVVVKRTPVGFSPALEPLQRLYYALDTMGLLDRLHERVFRAIHDERQRLLTEDAITNWLAKQGVDSAQFRQVYKSFGVIGRVRRATQLQDAYEVEGTPALGIGGRFYVPGQAAHTLVVANALIAQLRRT